MKQTQEHGNTIDSVDMVEFSFQIEDTGGNPFMAPVCMLLEQPDGSVVTIPAFYDGADVWRVRFTPLQQGTHRVACLLLGEDLSVAVPITAKGLQPQTFNVSGPLTAGFLRCSPSHQQRFQFDDGTPYFPMGFNVAWGAVDNYPIVFGKMADHGLNWSRVWMNHWGSMTLNWVMGKSLEPGDLDLEVARRWDSIVRAAEDNGVAIQLVLQSHGQFSTTVNPVWQEHPWNIDNGGWLSSPADFFTDAKALELTRAKYRYVVARWGYSNAIMAWELFNEVEFTDGYIGTEFLAIRKQVEEQGLLSSETLKAIMALQDRLAERHPGLGSIRVEDLLKNFQQMDAGNQQQLDYGLGRYLVAKWHGDMAAYIRSIDPNHHMITTSSLPIDSLVWNSMDYYQGHLYRREMIKPLAELPLPFESLQKPYFVAEMGDHSIVDLEKSDGRYMHSMLWAGLFSGGAGAAQVWAWDRVEPWGLYKKFAILSEFAARARMAETDYRPTPVTFIPNPSPESQSVEPVAYMLSSEDMNILWVCDLKGVPVAQPFPISGMVRMEAPTGIIEAKVSWIDTRTGKSIGPEISYSDFSGQIDVPAFQGDSVAIIFKTKKQ